MNYNIGNPNLGGGYNEAQAGPWPLFSAVPGADIATSGGEFDQWNLDGEVTVATTFINTPDFAFAISPNLTGMTSGKAWVNPTTCKMTVYYVLPCTDTNRLTSLPVVTRRYSGGGGGGNIHAGASGSPAGPFGNFENFSDGFGNEAVSALSSRKKGGFPSGRRAAEPPRICGLAR